MGGYWATLVQTEARLRPRITQRIRWLSHLRSLPWSLLFVFLVVSRDIAADFTGHVVAVLDGDTFEVLHNHKGERIRLNGIDCPEKGQAYGEDNYGRTIADVLLRMGPT
jgi:endonuclease YncB( thermonuclease family)